MSTFSLVLLFALFIIVLLSRLLGERQVAALSREEKLRLIEDFRDLRRLNALSLLAILAIVGAPLFAPSLPLAVTQVGLVLLVVSAAVHGLISIRRLKALDFSPRFIRFYYLRTSVMTVGMALYAITLLIW